MTESNHFAEYWEKSNNRRIFFEDYASSNGFDPYNPENWYMQQKHKILTKKVRNSFLFHFILFVVT